MTRTGRFLLDTNIVIALFAADTAVQQHLTETNEVFVPSIVIGELYYGAHKSARVMENLARIDEFVASNTVLSCDTETAQQYGDIKNKLRAKGRPIPENDIWIAAIVTQYQLTLVTRDRHFHEVDGLRVEEWSPSHLTPNTSLELTAHSVCFFLIIGFFTCGQPLNFHVGRPTITPDGGIYGQYPVPSNSSPSPSGCGARQTLGRLRCGQYRRSRPLQHSTRGLLLHRSSRRDCIR